MKNFISGNMEIEIAINWKKLSRLWRNCFIFFLIFAWTFLPLADVLTFEIGGRKISLAPEVQVAQAAAIAQYSGGLLVYSDGTAGTPKYQTFDDTAGFGSEQSATSVGAVAIEWIRVAASPISDEWIIVTRDAGDVIKAQVCTGVNDGVSCGSATTITATAGTHGLRNFDVAYEYTSGDALLVYGTATADELRKIEWTGGSWQNDAAITTTRTGGTVEWVELTSRPASNQIGIAYSDDANDVSAYRWSGTAAADEATAVITATASTNDVRKLDVSFQGTSGTMDVAAPVAAAGTTAVGQLVNTTWTIAANTNPDNITDFIDLAEPNPSDNDISMVAHGVTAAGANTMEGYEIDGVSITTTAGILDGTIAVDTSATNWGANYQLGATAYLSSTYYGVTVFSDVTGGDDINWWTMNSAGVWVAQADNLRTRGTIRFVDLFDYPNADKVLLLSQDANSDLWADTWDGATPSSTIWVDLTSGGTLEDALASATTDVVDFAFRLAPNVSPTPTFHDIPFDNEKTGDSTPDFEFTASDPDGPASIIYQIQIDDDSAFGTPLVNCESDAACAAGAGSFTNTVTGGDTNPFNEGERMRFTPTTAMTTGTTYYWRVRAEDTSAEGGSGAYGSYGTTRSVTFVSGTSPSEWFQTTDEQFDTDTLVSTKTNGSDQVILGASITATGGTITESGGYKLHTFTGSGTFQVTVGSGNVDVLIVAGGAAGGTGGTAGRGGGGAGGIVASSTYAVTVDSYTVTVGGGGVTGTSAQVSGSGDNSVFGTLTALGGGGAGPHATAGTAGGSGGGGSGYLGEAGGAGNQPGSGSGGFGNAGGTSFNGGAAPGRQGGGGGAGAVGQNGQSTVGGDGGVGQEYSQFSSVGGSPAGWFGGGGGGGATTVSTGGAGGQGGGGAGGSGANGTAGTANTGGGGGGSTSNGGAGGSGIVIVRYLNSGASSGTIMSPEIDFDWVSGQNTWGNAAFATTETNGDVKLRAYYTVTTACDTIVPNGTLSGNSSGFDVSASPVNIAGLTPVASTYNKICLQATLTDVSGTPFLNDWTVTWSTGAASAPTVTTNTATGVGVASAILNGEITATGGSNSTVRGFAWGTNSTLSSASATTTESGDFGTGTFSQNVSGLLAGITYYFRAYATNPNGTGYGSIDNFVAGTDTTVRRKLRLFEGFTVKLISGKIILHQQ